MRVRGFLAGGIATSSSRRSSQSSSRHAISGTLDGRRHRSFFISSTGTRIRSWIIDPFGRLGLMLPPSTALSFGGGTWSTRVNSPNDPAWTCERSTELSGSIQEKNREAQSSSPVPKPTV
jgi:hypothetical protein